MIIHSAPSVHSFLKKVIKNAISPTVPCLQMSLKRYNYINSAWLPTPGHTLHWEKALVLPRALSHVSGKVSWASVYLSYLWFFCTDEASANCESLWLRFWVLSLSAVHTQHQDNNQGNSTACSGQYDAWCDRNKHSSSSLHTCWSADHINASLMRRKLTCDLALFFFMRAVRWYKS